MKNLLVFYSVFCLLFLSGISRRSFAQVEIQRNVVKRDDFFRSQNVFESTGKGRVAFLGGSITEMDGFRPMICSFLQKQFPETTFDFIDAGIASTCSTTGAFRLEADVLSRGKIDLFFVEFAVNDDQDANNAVERSVRGMEGIVRHIRKSYPDVDIVMIYFVNEHLMDCYRGGTVAPSVQAHEKVAERYQISTINLAREITEQIDSGRITWAEFGGVHPAPRGNRICADMIESLLSSDWDNDDGNSASERSSRSLPEPLDSFSYVDVGFLPFDSVQKDENWNVFIPDWSSIPGDFRQRFANRALLCADQPGASCSFAFQGSVVGAYVLAGPDAGTLEYRIDGRETQTIDLFHPFSSGLHYPRSVIFADELDSKTPHQIQITISAEKNPNSQGNAARILEILGNRPSEK